MEAVCGRGLAGEVVAAVKQIVFVPGLLPHSAGAGSGAGGDFSGWLFRSCRCWRVTPASLAGRGGEGRSESVGVLAAAWWWWFLVFGCALLWLLRCLHRPSPAGRGGEGGSAGDAVLRAAAGRKVGWCFFGLELLPVQGRRSDGGTSGAGGRSSATGAGSRLRASWPMLVHRFRSRRLTAGGSCSSKAWRCSPFQVSWWPAFLSSPGVAGVWEWHVCCCAGCSVPAVLA